MNIKSSTDCLLCFSNKVKKYGILKQGGQRYKCNECHHTFTIGGIRGTYNDEFKKGVVENYCHRKQRAKEVVGHYGISTRTLIRRQNDHQKKCKICNK